MLAERDTREQIRCLNSGRCSSRRARWDRLRPLPNLSSREVEENERAWKVHHIFNQGVRRTTRILPNRQGRGRSASLVGAFICHGSRRRSLGRPAIFPCLEGKDERAWRGHLFEGQQGIDQNLHSKIQCPHESPARMRHFNVAWLLRRKWNALRLRNSHAGRVSGKRERLASV